VVVGALAAGGGCNRAPEPSAHEDPADAPAPAQKPDVPLAEPDLPPEPVEGTVLVDGGTKARRSLRYAPSVGSSRRWVVTVRVNTRQGAEPAPLSPRARFEIETTVDSAGETVGRRFEIVGASILREDDVAPESVAAAEARVVAYVGHSGRLSLSPEGRVTSYAFDLDASADPEGAVVLAGLRTALEHHLVPVPTEEVSEGAAWEVTTRTQVQGVELWQVQRVGLRKREGDELELRADISFPKGELAGSPVGHTAISVETWEGKGELEARIDLAQAVPIETHLSLQGTFTGKDAAGTVVEGKVGVDVTVDEDYLSLRDHRVTLRGELTQGGLVRGKVEPGTKVWFEKRRVKVSPEGDFLLPFDRDARHRALLSFAFGKQTPERHVIHVSQRTYETERIDGLPESMVKLDGKTRTELIRANKRIAKVRAKVSEGSDFVEPFALPVSGRVTSTYGRPRILNGEDHGIHWGVDLAVPVGKKVKAPAGGVVVFVEDDVPLSGTLLILDHGHGLTSSFLHLKKVKVGVGDRVKKGQIIALSGNSGRSTGPHLDWRMNVGDVRVDPQLLVGK
jgi:hypothetical protein